MSTINTSIRPLAAPPEVPGPQPARSMPPVQSRNDDLRGNAGMDRAAGSHGAAPASEPATGKVYALKDGSGYVALASDGHYYRLEAGASGMVFASASGPVDTANVDVTHGPVRSMQRAAVTHPAARASHDTVLPEPGGHAEAGAGTRLPGTGRKVPGEHETIGPHAGADSPSGASGGSGPAEPGPGDHGDNGHVTTARGPRGAEAAAAAVRATHGLILRHPVAALRSHAAVSADAVAALLR